MYEYKVTYYHVEYFIESRTEERVVPYLPSDPNPESLTENEAYIIQLNDMASEGWELVNVVPLLRSCYHEGRGYGYSLTAGYYHYWKRKK